MKGVEPQQDLIFCMPDGKSQQFLYLLVCVICFKIQVF